MCGCRMKLSGNAFKAVAGLAPVGVGGIEDVDCTPLVSTHAEWPKHMHTVLEALQLSAAV